MTRTGNILELKHGQSKNLPLEAARLNKDETFFVPFTLEYAELDVHYCDEAEIRGYVTCDGEGCLLCRVGKDAEPRRLLPLYVPTERRVDVLMMSTSSRPGALMPQLIDTLASAFGGDGSERVVLSIRKRDYYKFEISSRLLPEDVDDGTEVIKRFMADVEAGKIDITSVVQRFTTKSLLAIPAIAQRAALKGVEARP